MMSLQYMNLYFPLNGALRLQILERPLLWMERSNLLKIREELIELSSRVLGKQALDYGIFREDLNAFGEGYLTLLRDRKTGHLLGFNAMPVMAWESETGEVTEVFHLGLVMVDPNARSKGMTQILYGLSCMLIFMRKGLRPIHVSSVTQVPAIFGMVSEVFSQVTPRLGQEEAVDYQSYQLAEKIMMYHRAVFGVGEDAGFDTHRFVITNAYTGGSDHLKKRYADAPKHRIDKVNSFCKAQLDYERGDDFIQIGQLDFAALKRYVRKALPKNSLLSFGAISLFALMQHFVLPPLHWLNVSKRFNSLEVRHEKH